MQPVRKVLAATHFKPVRLAPCLAPVRRVCPSLCLFSPDHPNTACLPLASTHAVLHRILSYSSPPLPCLLLSTTSTSLWTHADFQITIQTPDGPAQRLTPCSPGDPAAQEKSWTDVESAELHEPILQKSDFDKSIEVNRPTVSQADIQKHIAFTNESGESVVLSLFGSGYWDVVWGRGWTEVVWKQWTQEGQEVRR